MMLFAGILILLGAAIDIAIGGYTGLHLIFIGCGLLLVLLNVFGHKLPIGIAISKNILSLGVIVLAGLCLFGFFSGNKLLSSDNTSAVIKKAEKISQKSGAAEASAYIKDAAATLDWNRNLAFKTAGLLAMAGKYEDAVRKYEEILSKDPFDIEARYQISLELMKVKKYEQAIERLLNNLKLDPSHADSYMSLGDCYWALGDNIRGLYYYKLSVNLEAASVEKHVKLALAYARMQSYEEADQTFKTALGLAKDFDEEMLIYNGYSQMKTQISQNSENKAAAATVK